MADRPRLTMTATVLDAPDANALADFYQRLLGWPYGTNEPGWVTLRPPDGSMGLSFAFNLDPQRGGSSSTPALGQLFTLLVMLTFLALNGHLSLIRVLARSFSTFPVGADGLGGAGLYHVVAWGSYLFAGALAIALPGVTALLVVHLGFGVVSRAAPALNLFAVGLPVSLLCGLVVILAALFSVQATFIHGLEQAYRMLGSLIGAAG